ARLKYINDRMSTYLPESEISRFNQTQNDDWFEVSPETAAVLGEALEISEKTAGAFDVTVGPLVNLWSFGPEGRHEEIPTDDEIEKAKADVGFRHVEVRSSPPALRKTFPDAYVDLSAIAKGYAVDEVARVMDGLGITRYMVEIGGEVRTRGRKQDGTFWRIGIEKPVSTARVLQHIVELEDRALATSGDYRNFLEKDGQRYSHTIDPRTGRPVEHNLASASVISDNCTFADAMATALTVMGPDEAFRYATNNDIDVLLIIRVPDGFEVKTTKGFGGKAAQ
ncbi:MAG: FAD:protein FMN transferase, partial [Planctomycetes bacterium]|nr:FAD:protein FMN transferase [Planctomycetota bacterium]